jgi:hypothetical protein
VSQRNYINRSDVFVTEPNVGGVNQSSNGNDNEDVTKIPHQ